MSADYAKPDWAVVDYQMYCLDPHVVDLQTNTGLMLRGPAPERIENDSYFVCIGAAQVFGRFCEEPFPTLLQERIGVKVLNLGRGGAGPSFFLEEELLSYVNRARFAVIQVMSGRSASNSLFESSGLGYYVRRSDGTGIGCDQAFREILGENDEDFARTIVAETRQNWLSDYKELLGRIRIPKILFWFSVREPDYSENYKDTYTLFGEFPQLVNSDMVHQLRTHVDEYVECISSRGLPQLLLNRFSGEPTTVEDPWGGTWTKNWYYPSPEMHVEAADALEGVCKGLLNQGDEFALHDVPSLLRRGTELTRRKGCRLGELQSHKERYAFHLSRAARSSGLVHSHSNYVRFIVLSTARSGSNLLLGLLNSHSQIVAFGELFRSDDAIGWDLPGYDEYLQSKRLISLMQDDPVRFLEKEVFGRYPRHISAVGFKIFYHHAQDNPRKVIWEFLRDRESLKVLHLKRRNTLRLILSLKKAHVTDRWTNRDGSEEDRLAISLDYNECLQGFVSAPQIHARFDALFKDHDVMEVLYEDLAADHMSQMRLIQEFLGLKCEATEPSTYKQANQPLSQAISNYSELKRQFSDTPWAEFFRD